MFLVPVFSDHFALGQIAAAWAGELYTIVFDLSGTEAELSLDAVLTAKPLIGALSLDAKLHHGHWKTIGNLTANLSSIKHPYFKVFEAETAYVESRDRTVYRKASRKESAELRLRTVVAPIRLEKAIKARFGNGPWLPIYDELLYSYSERSVQIAG